MATSSHNELVPVPSSPQRSPASYHAFLTTFPVAVAGCPATILHRGRGPTLSAKSQHQGAEHEPPKLSQGDRSAERRRRVAGPENALVNRSGPGQGSAARGKARLAAGLPSLDV